MRELDIGEVSRRSGVSASALRYYEEIGLVRPIGRRGLRRQYDEAVLERLALVALGRAAGFPLDEIASIFAVDGRARIDRMRLAQRADELDATIRTLGAMRDGLRHAAACRAPSHLECPTFRRLLRAAAAGVLVHAPAAARGTLEGARRGVPRAKRAKAGDGRRERR